MKPLVAFAMLVAVSEAAFFWGSCPDPTVVQSIDLEKFEGQWHEMARTSSVPYSTTNDCNSAHYTLNDDTIDVENCTYEAEKGTYRCVNGMAYCTDGSGDCHVRFSKWAPYGNYTILDINYASYLAVWSCTNFYIFNLQYSWLLARDNDFEALPTVEIITSQTDLTADDFVFTNQNNCPNQIPVGTPTLLLSDDDDDDIYLMTYNGSIGKTYDDNSYVKADANKYAVAEEDLNVAAHPSYSIATPAGNLLLSGDSFGDKDGRGWANLFDQNAKFKWGWHSTHSKFDAILGAGVLPDETVILGGTRSVDGGYWTAPWELLLVAIAADGTEKWSTTMALSSPNPPRYNGWDAIYWVDVDPVLELLIIGGVVDHPAGADGFAWKSGGGYPDDGGVPFIASIPYAKLANAPTIDDIQASYFFDYNLGYPTVVSLRTDHGKGVVALLPSEDDAGAVARLSYDSGKFKLEWLQQLDTDNQVTDIAILRNGSAVTGYVVMGTVNPGALVETLSTDGTSVSKYSYDINHVYPPSSHDKGFWCQECWSIWTLGEEVMVSCGVAMLEGGDQNCDDGVWRSLIVTYNSSDPKTAAYSLFHPNPDENFSVEYASYGANGEIICAIDADNGGSIVRIDNSKETTQKVSELI